MFLDGLKKVIRSQINWCMETLATKAWFEPFAIEIKVNIFKKHKFTDFYNQIKNKLSLIYLNFVRIQSPSTELSYKNFSFVYEESMQIFSINAMKMKSKNKTISISFQISSAWILNRKSCTNRFALVSRCFL